MYVTYDKEIDYNYLTLENDAKIVNFSSQCKGCAASNIICNDKKSIWLTDGVTPQYVVIDYSNLTKKPKRGFNYFGLYCWHAYSTNPKKVELLFSKDNKNFVSFGIYDIALKPGNQFFEIRDFKLLENKRYRYLKFVIKEAYGGNRTYVNQIYFFEDLSGMNTNTSTINTNKLSTQYSDNKRNIAKSETESVYIYHKSRNNSIVEEEEESVRQIDVERSKLNTRLSDDLKDYSRQKIDFIDKSIENKRIMFEEKMRNKNLKRNKIKMPENKKGDYRYDDIQDDIQKISLKDSRIKKGKKVIKNYENEYNEEKSVENIAYEYDYDNEDSSDYNDINEDNCHSAKKDKKNKIFNRKSSHDKNRYFIQQYRKNSNLDEKNKIYSKEYNENKEYKILESQLKDMEDHLYSMQTDKQLQSFKSDKYYHSRSFSYLNPIHDKKNNPFHEFNSFKSLNKTSDRLFSHDNNKNTISNENIMSQYICDDILQNNHNIDNKLQIEKKIDNLENKIQNFEKEISDMKQNFNSLMININRLIESNEKLSQFNPYNNIPCNNSDNASNQYYNCQNFPQNSLNINNQSNLNSLINHQLNKINLNNTAGEQMNQNEMMSILLNECQNLINEKFNANQFNQTQNSNNFGFRKSNIIKSRKSSLGKLEFRQDHNDDVENELSFEKSNIKICNKSNRNWEKN